MSVSLRKASDKVSLRKATDPAVHAENQRAVAQIAEESPEAAGLVYGLITASMDANNRTLDALLDGKDEQIKHFCRGLVAIGDALDAATVIDRQTEARLRMFDGLIWSAQDTLDRMNDKEYV
jgi:hypothetical protein